MTKTSQILGTSPKMTLAHLVRSTLNLTAHGSLTSGGLIRQSTARLRPKCKNEAPLRLMSTLPRRCSAASASFGQVAAVNHSLTFERGITDMQIESNIGGYNYQGRIRDIEKAGSAQSAPEEQTVKRGPGNPTVSSTILSKSLANVLWAVGNGSAPARQDTPAASAEDTADAQVEWVRSAYSEYTE